MLHRYLKKIPTYDCYFSKLLFRIIVVLSFVGFVGCSKPPAPETNVIPEIEKSLRQAGYDDLSVKRGQAGITISGTVVSNGEKENVNWIAKNKAGALWLDNKVAVSAKVAEPTKVTLDTASTNYDVVRVFYATDRQLTNSQAPIATYNGERSDSDKLSLGTLDVSIPRDHKLGEMERPSILRFEFREDPDKHIVLLRVSPKPDENFFQELSAKVDSSLSKQTLVFIHGYDVPFDEAARRTAQIAYDLGFDGAPILYSWPSKGQPGAYPVDATTIYWTTPHLKNFLERVARESHATSVTVIAHSLGNFALTNALSTIATEHASILPIFRNIFLAAPDIDIGVFKQLAANFPLCSQRVTLYASSRDQAMRISQHFNGRQRAGDSNPNIIVVSKVDSVDASAVDTGLIGHSYYDNASILTDIFYTMRDNVPPGQRFGMHGNKPQNPTYWIFAPQKH
jgi:esterase/lipase superfamily enzyme